MSEQEREHPDAAKAVDVLEHPERWERRGALVWVRLDRPTVRVADQLVEALRSSEQGRETAVMLTLPERIALMAALLKGGHPNPRFLRRAQIKLATVDDPEARDQMIAKEGPRVP